MRINKPSLSEYVLSLLVSDNAAQSVGVNVRYETSVSKVSNHPIFYLYFLLQCVSAAH